MKKLENTLYIMSPETRVSKDGDNLVVQKDAEEIGRFPVHLLESVISFTYSGISTQAMILCSENSVPIFFMSPNGRFISSVTGPIEGNVLLRRAQFRAADNEEMCLKISKNMIRGKITNSMKLIDGHIMEHHDEEDDWDVLSDIREELNASLSSLNAAEELDVIRGIEGDAARTYFRAVDNMIVKNRKDFFLRGRSKRPPADRMNALLSFSYSILANETRSALMAVGLDPFVGFLHADRPGKPSLALDMMEELRSPIADRFVLDIVNSGLIGPNDFNEDGEEGIVLDRHARKLFIREWQSRKRIEIPHRVLGEKIAMGLIPYVQSQILARFLTGETDDYSPYTA